MKVGPLDLPVSNANQLAMFALLVVLIIFAARKLMPPSLAKYTP